MSEEQKPTALAEWQGFADLAVQQNPSLKDKVNAASMCALMKLPDSAFGASMDKGVALSPAQKAMVVLAHLRLDLIPGAGHILILGTTLYLTAAGARFIASRSSRFRWLSKVPRALTADEKEMVGFEDGDRGMALDCIFLLDDVEVRTTGISIVDKAVIQAGRLEWTRSKSHLYQTLFTRAERDVLKRWLPVEGVAGIADQDEMDEMRNVTPETAAFKASETKQDEAEKAAERHRGMSELCKLAKQLHGKTVNCALGVRSFDETQDWPIEKIVAGVEALRDAIDEKAKKGEAKQPPQQGEPAATTTTPAPSAPAAPVTPPSPPTNGNGAPAADKVINYWLAKMLPDDVREKLTQIRQSAALVDEHGPVIVTALSHLRDGHKPDCDAALDRLLGELHIPI